MIMCIVVDTCTFGRVFDPNNSEHDEFKPVNEWVQHEGFLVLGGTHYLDELRKSHKYHGVLVELSKKGRVKRVSDVLVDEHFKMVQELLNGSACNDCHLIAIIRVSGCRLVCSFDKKADTYIKDRRYYLKGQKPPLIYRGKANKGLLCRRNIVSIRNVA